MKLYTAAVYTNNYMPGMARYAKLNDHEREIAINVPHILESYHYVGKQKFVDSMRNNGAKIFVDSGAFSAFNLNTEINLKGYCDYILRNEDIILKDDGILMASVLDGIGDPLQTYRNQLDMAHYGVKALPCFHAGEDERYLEYYVANYDYITLGGLVGSSTKQLQHWLDRIWDKYLTDGAGRPKIKVHGFGITSLTLVKRYPWHSCDASTWIQAAAFGAVHTPDYGLISVSDKSPTLHMDCNHLYNMSAVETEYLIEMFAKQGFDHKRLSTEYESRAIYNLWAFGEINDRINAEFIDTFAGQVQELF